MRIEEYNSIIFDCDGVILNSNKIKSKAFYESVIDFGEKFATELYNYHILNGGVSRYSKFEYFLNEIIKDKDSVDVNELLRKFSKNVIKQLRYSEVVKGLDLLKARTIDSKWSVVSGGDQLELIEIFKKKKIEYFFDDGIFGSPDDKYNIISKRILNGYYSGKVLFLGDSKLDFEVADSFGFDFVFIHQWTEFTEWNEFCIKNKIISVDQPMSLLNYFKSE